MSQSSKQLINSADRSMGKIGCGRDLESRFNPTNGYSDTSEHLRDDDDQCAGREVAGWGLRSTAPNKKQKRLAQCSQRPHRPHFFQGGEKVPWPIGGLFAALKKRERRGGKAGYPNSKEKALRSLAQKR
jgi:hypothetical protein